MIERSGRGADPQTERHCSPSLSVENAIIYWWKGCLLYENKTKKTSESHDTPLYNLP